MCCQHKVAKVDTGMNKNLILNVFLQNNSLNTLIGAVSTAFRCPVIVTDNAFHIVSSAAAGDYADKNYRLAISHSELPLSVCTAVTEGFENGTERITAVIDGRGIYVSCLKSSGADLGYIIYIYGKDACPDEGDCVFAESLIAKQFYIEKHTNGVSTDTAEEIMIDLLDGKFKSEEVFSIKTAGTFLAHFHPLKFALIDISGIASDDIHNNYIERELAGSFHASHPFFYDGRIMLFLHKDHDIGQLKAFTEKYGFRCVISDSISKLYSVGKAYKTVHNVLNYLTEKQSGSFLAESGDYALLMLLRTAAEHTDYSDRQIEALYKYDVDNGSELCLTLYTYFTCRHSLQETSNKLFTHRNTVQYRIHRIRDTFGIDTDNPDIFAPKFFALASALVRLGRDDLFIQHGITEQL